MFQVQSQEEETQKLDITTVPSAKCFLLLNTFQLSIHLDIIWILLEKTAFTKDFNAYLEYVKMLYIMIRVLYCGHTWRLDCVLWWNVNKCHCGGM